MAYECTLALKVWLSMFWRSISKQVFTFLVHDILIQIINQKIGPLKFLS